MQWGIKFHPNAPGFLHDEGNCEDCRKEELMSHLPTEQYYEQMNEEMYDYFAKELEEYFNSNEHDLGVFTTISIKVLEDLIDNLKESKKKGELKL